MPATSSRSRPRARVKLNIAGSLDDPTDLVGRLLFNVSGMIAEFEFGLIRMRTREDIKVAKTKGRLRGNSPNSSPRRRHTSSNCGAGMHTSAEPAGRPPWPAPPPS
jgi:Resolvase, N terminal domain